MATIEEVFEQFKQLPDWDKYPMPEVFYDHFKVRKPKPSNGIMDSLAYQPPLSLPLNNGKVEIRKPAEGGIREIKDLMVLPVEQTLIKDESDDDMKPDSDQTTLTPPTEYNSSEIQPASDLPSEGPSGVVDGSDLFSPYRGAEYNLAFQKLQSE